MTVDHTDAERVSLLLAAATAFAGLALWPALPAEVAIHFSSSGTPGTYVPRAVGVALVPALQLVTLGILRGAARLDPPDDERVVAVTTLATTALLAAVHGIVLAWNLGHDVPFDLVLVGVGVWAVALLGYALRRERGLPGS